MTHVAEPTFKGHVLSFGEGYWQHALLSSIHEIRFYSGVSVFRYTEPYSGNALSNHGSHMLAYKRARVEVFVLGQSDI